MTKMKKLAIIGCGNLANIVVDAIIDGILPNYQLIGAMSRTLAKANDVANKINNSQIDYRCKGYDTTEQLLALKPDYIVETASPDAFKSFAIDALKNGSSIITLSIGAFADKAFYEEVQQTAQENNAKVYIASGAIGGLDVMRTATMMYDSKATFTTQKGPRSLRGSDVYDPAIETEEKEVFRGSAKDAIALLPHQVNVSVAASLATVGPENIDVSINSIPDYVGDRHTITIQNEEIDAVISVYSKTPAIAGWSVVNTLRNITSPIVF
jgi:aspartate dehydrogenase